MKRPSLTSYSDQSDEPPMDARTWLPRAIITGLCAGIGAVAYVLFLH